MYIIWGTVRVFPNTGRGEGVKPRGDRPHPRGVTRARQVTNGDRMLRIKYIKMYKIHTAMNSMQVSCTRSLVLSFTSQATLVALNLDVFYVHHHAPSCMNGERA